MSIIKETIRFNGLDSNIKFGVDMCNNMLGIQQEIDGSTNAAKEELVNPIVDGEVVRFKYNPIELNAEITFLFANSVSQYANTFQNAGFSTAEIIKLDAKLLNSFYIVDVYDSYDPYTQSKILTNYMTKVFDGEDNGSYCIPKYKIGTFNRNQLYYLHIPKSFINTMTSNTSYLYIKFTFFNAINGGVNLFYNNANAWMLTPQKMYFKIQINKTNLTWEFYENSFPNIVGKELSSDSAYTKRVENTVNAQDVKKQNYPSGSVFDYVSGTYSTE